MGAAALSYMSAREAAAAAIFAAVALALLLRY